MRQYHGTAVLRENALRTFECCQISCYKYLFRGKFQVFSLRSSDSWDQMTDQNSLKNWEKHILKFPETFEFYQTAYDNVRGLIRRSHS